MELEELELELELEEEMLDRRDERLLEELLEELLDRRLKRWLEELLDDLFDVLLRGSARSNTLLLFREEEELEEVLEELDEERLERELLELELLELECKAFVLFLGAGARIFFSFIRTFLSSRISSSSLKLTALMIFSAAFSPIWISISILSMDGPAAEMQIN